MSTTSQEARMEFAAVGKDAYRLTRDEVRIMWRLEVGRPVQMLHTGQGRTVTSELSVDAREALRCRDDARVRSMMLDVFVEYRRAQALIAAEPDSAT
jgi:hypothetical protein